MCHCHTFYILAATRKKVELRDWKGDLGCAFAKQSPGELERKQSHATRPVAPSRGWEYQSMSLLVTIGYVYTGSKKEVSSGKN
jgi:hypothetical protein